MTPEPGIYIGIPFDEYRTWDAVSDSTLSTLQEESPAHARVFQLYPDGEESKAYKDGRLYHCLALEPDKFAERYIIKPDRPKRSKADKEFWADFEASTNGKEAIDAAIYGEAVRGINDIKRLAKIYRYIQDGDAEVCIVWVDKATGILCKARLDYLRRSHGTSIIIDLKTARNASPKAFQKAIWNYRYYQKAGFYCDGLTAITGDPSLFVLLALEKKAGIVLRDGEPPRHAVGSYEVDDNIILAGRKEYRKAIKIYAECLRTGEWPSYSTDVQIIQLPDWALRNVGVSPYEETGEE